jgi:hypothetical protein
MSNNNWFKELFINEAKSVLLKNSGSVLLMEVEELKQATNWSTYADIIVPLSTLAE